MHWLLMDLRGRIDVKTKPKDFLPKEKLGKNVRDTKFFTLRFMAQARSAREKKRGSVTYGTDQEDEVSKIFIISLLCVSRVWQ